MRENSVGGRGEVRPDKGDAHRRFLEARTAHPECRCFINAADGSFRPDDGLSKGRRWRWANDAELSKVLIEIARSR
jgi:hypothetical protein